MMPEFVLVTPPWDLCGGPGLDYDDPFDLWGVRRSKPRPDPNGRDARWGELAFMPHSTVPFAFVGRTVFVPAYPSLREALMFEAVGRELVRFVRRVEGVHERVACPKCCAPVGERCRRARAQHTRRGVFAVAEPVLKHPHTERLQADGIYERRWHSTDYDGLFPPR